MIGRFLACTLAIVHQLEVVKMFLRMHTDHLIRSFGRQTGSLFGRVSRIISIAYLGLGLAGGYVFNRVCGCSM